MYNNLTDAENEVLDKAKRCWVPNNYTYNMVFEPVLFDIALQHRQRILKEIGFYNLETVSPKLKEALRKEFEPRMLQEN